MRVFAADKSSHCFAEGGRESVSEIAESGVLTSPLLPGLKISVQLLYER
jgi:hypothetical protein